MEDSVCQEGTRRKGFGEIQLASTLDTPLCRGMCHEDEALLANGREKESLRLHLLMHLLYIDVENGRTSVSRFTMPNPLGVQAY